MQRLMLLTTVVLGLSLATMLLVSTYTEIGRDLGQEWGSLDGPEPVWPAVLGFASMTFALLSGVMLAVLAIVTVGREITRSRREDRQEGQGVA